MKAFAFVIFATIVQAEFNSLDECKEECKKDIGPVMTKILDGESDTDLLSHMVRWYIVLVLSTTL